MTNENIIETLEQKGRNVCRLRMELGAAEVDIAETFAKAKSGGLVGSLGDLSTYGFRATKPQLVQSATKRLLKATASD